MSAQAVCWLVAFVLFVVGAFWSPRPGVNLGWLGAAALTAGFLAPLLG